MSTVMIEKIEIVSFGKLKMVQVAPGKGINLLSAPNESGKSTLAAFIKFVFYGYTSGRVQSILDNDKKLYTPWDNPQSEGALYIKTESGRYKIERKYLQSGKETLEVFETHSGKLLNTGVQPGEHFFGVNEVTFEKTAFFRQLTIPSGKDEYIAEQLQNIAMSADEQISTKKALKRLTDARNMLSGRAKSGLIPKMEADQTELEQKLTDAADTNKMILELVDKITDSKKMASDNGKILEKLTAERENINKYEAALRLSQLKELERTEARAKLDYTEAMNLLNTETLPDNAVITSLLSLNAEYKSDLRNKEKVYSEITKEEEELGKIQNGVGTNKEKAEELKKKVKRRNIVAMLFSTVGLVLLITGLIFRTTTDYHNFFNIRMVLGLFLSTIGNILNIFTNRLITKQGFKSLKDLEATLSNYPLFEQRINDKKSKILSLNNAYAELVNKTEIQKNKLEAGISDFIRIDKAMSYEEQIEFISDTAQKIRQKLEAYKANNETRKKATHNLDIDTLTAEATGAVKPEREKLKVDNEISFYSQQKKIFEDKEREYDRQKALLEGKGSDPAVLMGKRDSVKKKLEEYRKKYASLDLAVSILSESSEVMKSTVAPRINKYASEFFAGATNKKYETLSVDTTMAMNFEDKSGTKSCDYLSAGTRDSAYLCLRFALIKLLYGGINPPVILDDAFGRLDDDRLEALLSLLSTESNNSQTFILTCGDREQKLLDRAGKQYSLLTL